MWTGSRNLSELSSPSIRCSFIGLKQRKWKWRKALHVSHCMKGCFWLVQITLFIDYSWREKKALKGGVSWAHHVDNWCIFITQWGTEDWRNQHANGVHLEVVRMVDNLLCPCPWLTGKFMHSFWPILHDFEPPFCIKLAQINTTV